MAKKQAISYGPNTALIKGARDVAQSEVMKTSAGGTAFAQGLTGAVMAGIEEQEKRNAKMDAHLDNLKGVENINLLEEDYNKQAVTDFVRNGRDEYAKLAASYEKTKDRATLDKMDAIKFSFQNLNTQLQGLVSERKEYLSAYDKGQLVTLGNGDEKFTDMYTNNSQFSIESNGDIGFGSSDSYGKFKDQAGKWNVKNNIGETYTLKQNLNARKLGETGKSFYKNDTKNLYAATFKETGPEGIMVMAKTDLTGDNEYILPNGERAGNMSFESMWSQGFLDDKFYKTFPKGTDSSWMYDKANTGVLNDIMSEYYTDVTEFSYNEGKKNFKPKGSGGGGDGDEKNVFIGRSRIDNSSIYAKPSQIQDKYNRITSAQDGDVVEGWDGKRTYRYRYVAPSKGNPFWQHQIWDAKNEQFRTKGGLKTDETKVKKYSTNDVIGEFVPQSMLGGNSNDKPKKTW